MAASLAGHVEAACFVSANKSSEERYRMVIATKTAELCQSLLARPQLSFLRPQAGKQPPVLPADEPPSPPSEWNADDTWVYSPVPDHAFDWVLS
jgi:hypothetical protein